jgi:hypothetical protein
MSSPASATFLTEDFTMTRLILCGALVGALALTGCHQNSSTAPSTNPAKPGEARKLTVTSPGDQTVTVNNTDKFTVRIDRDHFTGPVNVQLQDLPAGVSVVNTDMTIPDGKDSLEVTIKADASAKPVDKHHVKLMARAKDVPETSVMFDVSVKAK